MKTLIGKLSETSVGKFYLRTKDGDKQLFFDAPHRTPTDTKIAIAVFDDFHVDPTVWYYNVLTPDSVDTDLIRMVIMRQIRDNPSEEEKANELHKAQLRARDLQDFYNYYAKIVWEYKAEGFVYVSGNNASSPGYDAHVVDPAIAALNLSYVPDKIQVWQRWDPNNGRCGEATLWGKRGVAVEGCPQRTCNHEAGHSQGMSHSSSLNDNGSRSEYGGKDCIMGGASHIPGICAPQQQKMGMLSQRSQRTVDTNCEVLICPLELSDHAMFWQEDKVVTIRVPGHSDYTLSLRKDKGVPYRTGSAYRNGKICIHTMEGRYAVLVGTLNPGDSHDLFGVVNITYKEYGNETAVVNIKYAADRMPIL